MEIESLSKKAVKSLADETDGDVSEMLKLRLLMAKTSVKKYEAVIRSVCSDNRVHGMMRFCGANRTGSLRYLDRHTRSNCALYAVFTTVSDFIACIISSGSSSPPAMSII